MADTAGDVLMRLAEFAAELRQLHSPFTEEAECWADGDEDQQRVHAERFPECDPTDCNGHTYEMQVCIECGYTTSGDYVEFRPWPCATLRALNRLTEASA